MARQLFDVENGIGIGLENSDSKASVLVVQAAPGGTTDTDEALVGSLACDIVGARVYYKKEAGTGTDKWAPLASNEEITNFSVEAAVKIVTNDAIVAGVRDLAASPFADDDGAALGAADLAVDDIVIADADGTPAAFRVTNISGDDVTFAAEAGFLVANKAHIARYYLPDSDGQENQALVQYDGSTIIKLGDIDWNFADGINIQSGYAAVNGTITDADTVQSAIEKLDGNQQDIQTASGLSQGDVDYGTFTGNLLSDNATAKTLFQELEAAVEAQEAQVSVDGVTSAQTIDEVLVDSFAWVEWEIYMRDNANPSRVRALKLSASHDGTDLADATDTDTARFARLRLGASFNRLVTVDLNGTGATQTMRLRISSSETNGIDVRVRRTAIKF
jgi:hypothetical protein